MSTINVYTFEDKNGTPYGSYETQDISQARGYAQTSKTRVIVNEYEFSDSYLLDGEDYTPRPRFEFINADDVDITGDDDQEKTACRVRAYDEGTDTAAAEVMRDESTWYVFWPLGSSAEGCPAWRDAMKAAGVSDFRELDD